MTSMLPSGHEAASELVRAGGLEPPRAYARRIFLPATAFAAALREPRVWSLDYPFTMAAIAAVGAARLVSTPSPAGAWLGIASEGFPEFGQFYVQGFPRRTQIGLSPLRLPIPPRPRDRGHPIGVGEGLPRGISLAARKGRRFCLCGRGAGA